MIDGVLIKDVLLKDCDIPIDHELLESLEFHSIITLSKGVDPTKPFNANIYGTSIADP